MRAVISERTFSKSKLWFGLGITALGVISSLVVGCRRVRPLENFGGVQLDMRGESDGLLRMHLEQQLTFAGISVVSDGRYRLEISEMRPQTRETGFRNAPKSKRLLPCEAEVTLQACVRLIDQISQRTLGNDRVHICSDFDFEPKSLTQAELAFSRGNLTTFAEAKNFAQRELWGALAAKIADCTCTWMMNAPAGATNS